MMTRLPLIVLALALSTAGCAAEPTTAHLNASHPAHADAKQAACCVTDGKLLTASQSDKIAHTPGTADAHAGHTAAAPSSHDAHANHAAKPEATKDKPVPYPLSVCLVSGEDLGSMGKPYGFVHEGRQIMLCCKSCEKEFKADTAKFIKKFDEAAKVKQEKK